jgi:hypothetical protein
MDGLQFDPSDQVWIRLEQELNKRQRRPLPLFWLFILVGGMLIGAGGSWFFFGRNGHPVAAQQVASQPAVPQPAVPQLTGSHPAGSEPTALRSTGSSSVTRTSTPSSPAVSAPFTISSSTSQTETSRPSHPSASGTPDTEPVVGSTNTEPMVGTSGAEPLVGTANPAGSLSGSPVRAGLAPIRSYLTPSTIPLPALAASHMAASHTAAKKAIMYKRPIWQAGFTGGLGISALKQDILRQTMDLRAYALTTPAGVAYGGIPPSNSFINPKESPGLSFWAGVFVQKPIGRRLSISAGLNLHYYSTSIATGQQVTSKSNYPTPCLFYASAVGEANRFHGQTSWHISHPNSQSPNFPFCASGINSSFSSMVK